MYKNILKNIDIEKVVSLEFIELESKKVLKVKTSNEKCYIHKLLSGFQIFESNEFLRSMELMDEISFESYGLYAHLISLCNKLIPIRTLMKEITGKAFDEIGHTAQEIHLYILDVLFSKHKMETMLWDDVMKVRPIEEWVAEALADLM